MKFRIVASLIVIAAVLVALVLTGKLDLPSSGNKPKTDINSGIKF